jgi:hypothetical protein
MKRLVLFFTVLLTGLTTVTASELNSDRLSDQLDNPLRYGYAQPILFIERGVEFMIFPDGSFDFNTEINTYGDMYYRNTSTRTRSRRSSVNTTYGSPAFNNFGGVIVTHDSQGRVRRIGNVFINYDRLGKIKRAGSVYMIYNRGNGRLTHVGGMRVHYNSWGELVNSTGFVNHESLHLHSNLGFQEDIYTDDFYYEDEDFYYYKNGSKKKKEKDKKKIKR